MSNVHPLRRLTAEGLKRLNHARAQLRALDRKDRLHSIHIEATFTGGPASTVLVVNRGMPNERRFYDLLSDGGAPTDLSFKDPRLADHLKLCEGLTRAVDAQRKNLADYIEDFEKRLARSPQPYVADVAQE